MNNDKKILSGKYSTVIKIIIAVVVFVFLLPPGIDFGTKDTADVQADVPKELVQNSGMEDKEKTLAEDRILKDPLDHSMEFEMVIKAISKAWGNMALDKETFEEISKNEMAFETVNKLLDYRQDSTEIPDIFNLALQNYVKNDSAKEDIIQSYFEGNINFSLAREYQNGEWSLVLRSKLDGASNGIESSNKEPSQGTANKQVELD